MPCRSPGGGYPSMPCRSPDPHPGEVEGSGRGGLQVHTQGKLRGLAGGGGPTGPHPRGRLRGLARGVSRPTPGGSPGPHLGVYPSIH